MESSDEGDHRKRERKKKHARGSNSPQVNSNQPGPSDDTPSLVPTQPPSIYANTNTDPTSKISDPSIIKRYKSDADLISNSFSIHSNSSPSSFFNSGPPPPPPPPPFSGERSVSFSAPRPSSRSSDFRSRARSTSGMMTSGGNNSGSNSNHQRQRSAIACQYCRRRKIRCSGFDPTVENSKCSNCERHNQQCLFTPVSSATMHTLSIPTSIHSSLQPPPPGQNYSFPYLPPQQINFPRINVPPSLSPHQHPTQPAQLSPTGNHHVFTLPPPSVQQEQNEAYYYNQSMHQSRGQYIPPEPASALPPVQHPPLPALPQLPYQPPSQHIRPILTSTSTEQNHHHQTSPTMELPPVPPISTLQLSAVVISPDHSSKDTSEEEQYNPTIEPESSSGRRGSKRSGRLQISDLVE